MRIFLASLGAAGLVAMFIGVPAHARGPQPAAQAEEPHHLAQGNTSAQVAATPERQGVMNQNMMTMMSEMKAADAKLNALVETMNAAKGAAKTDAMAALLTAMVKENTMHNSMAMMMNMMGVMGTMNKMNAPAGTASDKPKP